MSIPALPDEACVRSTSGQSEMGCDPGCSTFKICIYHMSVVTQLHSKPIGAALVMRLCKPCELSLINKWFDFVQEEYDCR